MFIDGVEQGWYWFICRQHGQTRQRESSSQSSWGAWVGLWSSGWWKQPSCFWLTIRAVKAAWSFYFWMFLRTTVYIVITIFDVHTFPLSLTSASPYRKVPGLWNKVLDFLRPSQPQKLSSYPFAPFRAPWTNSLKRRTWPLLWGPTAGESSLSKPSPSALVSALFCTLWGGMASLRLRLLILPPAKYHMWQN